MCHSSRYHPSPVERSWKDNIGYNQAHVCEVTRTLKEESKTWVYYSRLTWGQNGTEGIVYSCT